MVPQTRDNFENGYFWELYADLERQFEDFLEYVPYLDGNESIYSFKLLNLILSIGGHVDSAFKEMARYSEFSRDETCKEILRLASERKSVIKPSLSVFEKKYGLSNKKVLFKRIPEREEIIPFRPNDPNRKTPNWWELWENYNGLKHDVGVNIKYANLKNALYALAGAFLLNVIHEPACVRLVEYRVVKPELQTGAIFTLESGWKDRIKKFIRDKTMSGVIETSLFIYEYSQ